MCPQDHTQHPCLQKLPLIFYNAIRSIANIADAFLGIYDPAIDQLHRDFILHNSANPGQWLIFQLICDRGEGRVVRVGQHVFLDAAKGVCPSVLTHLNTNLLDGF